MSLTAKQRNIIYYCIAIYIPVSIYHTLIPTKVERGAILAAVSLCNKNDGVMSIKRGFFDRYTFICRNSAKFEDIKVTISDTEPEDAYTLGLKQHDNKADQ